MPRAAPSSATARPAPRSSSSTAPKYDDWTLPKGKAERGESDEDCALREVEEETGLRCELLEELESSSYSDASGRPKVARYWLMRPVGGRLRPTTGGRRRPLGAAGRGRGAAHLRPRRPCPPLDRQGLSRARAPRQARTRGRPRGMGRRRRSQAARREGPQAGEATREGPRAARRDQARLQPGPALRPDVRAGGEAAGPSARAAGRAGGGRRAGRTCCHCSKISATPCRRCPPTAT